MKAKLYRVPTDMYSAVIVVEYDDEKHITGDVNPSFQQFSISKVTEAHHQHNIDCELLVRDGVHEEIEIHCTLLQTQASPVGKIMTFQYEHLKQLS